MHSTRLASRLFLLLSGLLTLIQPQAAEKFESVLTPDPLMGNYEGTWTAPDGKFKLSAQVRSLGSGQYDGFLLLIRDKNHVAAVQLKSGGANESGAVKISGLSLPAKPGGELQPKVTVEARLRDGIFEGTFSGDLGQGHFRGDKIVRQPDSLGARPPSDAIVLFDGKDTSRFTNFNWKVLGDGAMEVGGNNIVTSEKLGSFKLHLEFKTPFMPKARGQARGNSGVYLQSIYEVQVLDSFGLLPLQINDCSSIYGVKAASGNACLPPLQWQTYDITFREGKAGAPPAITVVHNGVTVVDQAPVPSQLVGKGGGGGIPHGGFLMLQNHGDPVQYRNIWAVRLGDL